VISNEKTTLASSFLPGEVAAALGVTPRTIYNWIAAGHLPSFKLPTGHYRIWRRPLMHFLLRSRSLVPLRRLGWRPVWVVAMPSEPWSDLVGRVKERVAEPEVILACDLRAAASFVSRYEPIGMAVDFSLGLPVVRARLETLRQKRPWMRLVGLIDPDQEEQDEAAAVLCDKVLYHPVDPMDLAEAITQGLDDDALHPNIPPERRRS
jgi:excisionase family DNA binding protein